MSKKLLAFFLAMILVLGTMPVLAISSSAEVKTNIALGKTVTTGQGVDGSAAVDDNQKTNVELIWTNDYNGSQALRDDCWLTVDLGEVTDVLGIGVFNYNASSRIYHFEVYGSTDNENWTKLCEKVDDTPADQVFNCDVEASARYVKIVGTYSNAKNTKKQGRFHIGEFQVYAMGEFETRYYDCGNGIQAAFDGTTLTFQGTGSAQDYSEGVLRPYESVKDMIKNVVIKGTVTYLGKNSLSHFTSIESIVVEEGVKELGNDCFAYCSAIPSVKIPASLMKLNQGVFYSTKITTVDCPLTSMDYANQCTIGAYNDNLFKAKWLSDPTEVLPYGDLDNGFTWAVDEESGTLTISGTGVMPKLGSVKPWKDFADGVTKVVFAEGITEISSGALSQATAVKEIYTPETVTKIGGDAFAYIGEIDYLKLSSNVTEIGQGVLFGTGVAQISCKKDWNAIKNQCSSIGMYNDSFGEAEWVDVEVVGEVHHLSFGKYGTGIENWEGNGDPKLTQILVSSPKWDGEWTAEMFNEAKNAEWTLTMSADDVSPVTMHLYPRSIYSDWIFRFVPALSTNPDERFVPVPGKVYTLTVTLTIQGVTDTVSVKGFALAEDQEPITFDNYYNITWQVNGVDEYTESIAEGFKPAYHGAAAPYVEEGITYDPVVPAVEPATADATYNVTYARHYNLSFGKYGTGIENWGDPLRTQLLIVPKWNGEATDEFLAACKAVEWELTLDDGADAFTTHLYVDSVASGILRFVFGQAQDPAERFVPVPGVEYTVTATVTLNGVTETVTSAETFVFPEGEEPVVYNYYTITWQIDGVTEYTEEVIEGFKPTYRGAAATYEDDSFAYVLVMPEIAAASADATYNLTYEKLDKTEGELGVYGDGYENWPEDNEQTQLLLCPVNWKGGELTDVAAAVENYTWIVNIDGVDYNVMPSSHYESMIFRFEPCLWAKQFVPQAGGAYAVGLTIKDADGNVVYKSKAPVTIEIDNDFEPVVPEPQGVPGDISGDGEVSIEDVTLLLDILAGGAGTPAGVNLDLDGDGEIGIADVTRLLDMLAS